MKRAMCGVTAGLLVLFLWMAEPLRLHAAEGAPGIQAESAALIDVESGRVLYSRQGDKQMRIASLTKIMTAIVAIERGNISDKVTVSTTAAGKEGSSVYLKAGEEISLENLLYALMLRSGNDAATAIAEHVGGSVEGFAYLMNEKASQLGLIHSHFANPSGLDAPDHYSSANDMAKLAAYALSNPLFQDIVKTPSKRLSRVGESWDTVWKNKNKMLSLYPGADGVKTGFTKLAKRCLVSSATRGGRQLAVVTLNDSDDWADHARLLDYGFAQFPLQAIIQKGESVQTAGADDPASPESGGAARSASGTVVAGRSFAYPLKTEERASLAKKIIWEKPGTAAYRLGERGKVDIYLGSVKIGTVPLYEPGAAQLKAENPASTSLRIGTASIGVYDDDAAGDLSGSEGSMFIRSMSAVLRALFTQPDLLAGHKPAEKAGYGNG